MCPSLLYWNTPWFHSMCRCRKLNLLGRQGASLFTSGFRRLFAKLLLRNWGEGGVSSLPKKRVHVSFPPPLPTPFTFPRKEPEIYILVPTCDSFQRIYFLFIVGKGRARKKADNSLNQKRNANAFLSLFLNIKETRDERRKVKFFGIF